MMRVSEEGHTAFGKSYANGRPHAEQFFQLGPKRFTVTFARSCACVRHLVQQSVPNFAIAAMHCNINKDQSLISMELPEKVILAKVGNANGAAAKTPVPETQAAMLKKALKPFVGPPSLHGSPTIRQRDDYNNLMAP